LKVATARDTVCDISGDISKSDALNAARLLLKAIRTLPEAEQDEVLAYLLDRALVSQRAARAPALSISQPPTVEVPLPWRATFSTESPARVVATQLHGPLRTMPVRFPEQQYERLKAWCEEHEFPMAVVVRGVVERFLDEQQRDET
jgi:hypothetical protein